MDFIFLYRYLCYNKFCMSWRSRRQGTIFGVFTLVFFVVIFILLYPILFKKPTCYDRKQNGTETGVDCGGQCSLYCPKTVALPRVDYSAVFPVEEDVYNVLTLLTSTAPSAGSRNAGYEITLYDELGKPIITKIGSTFIPPASQFAVFEPQIRTGKRTPVRARFVWKDDVIYFEKTNINLNNLPIDVSAWKRETVLGGERLTTNIINNSLNKIPESDYIVIVYDEKDEPIAASRTIASIDPRGSAELYYSWPYEFKSNVKRYELIKRINPFTYVQK